MAAWNEIMSGSKTKHNTKYRYYFNLLYVGITRTQQHMCFMDTDTEAYEGAGKEASLF